MRRKKPPKSPILTDEDRLKPEQEAVDALMAIIDRWATDPKAFWALAEYAGIGVAETVLACIGRDRQATVEWLLNPYHELDGPGTYVPAWWRERVNAHYLFPSKRHIRIEQAAAHWAPDVPRGEE